MSAAENAAEVTYPEYDDEGSVALELARAAQVWPSNSEEEDAYSVRLMKAVNDLESVEFDALPQAAQEWFDEAIVAYKAKSPLPELDGFDDLPLSDEERPVARVEKPEPQTNEQKKTKAKAARKEKKEKIKKEKAPKERKPREHGEGKIHHIMEAVYANPDAKVEDIIAGLEKGGHVVTKPTVTQVRSSMRHVLDFLKRKGVETHPSK